MLYQVIDVILESLLMIKKCLVDLALKTSIFVIDFSKHGATPDGFHSGGGGMTGTASRAGNNSS